MDTVYLVCAVIGVTLIICQFLLTLLGMGGHHDIGGGHDIGGHDMGGHDMAGHDMAGHDATGHDTASDHDNTHGSASNWFFSMLTFRTLTAAWDEYVTRMDPGGKQRSANAPGQLTPRRLVEDAIAFLEAKQTPDIKETVAQSIERMRIGSANAERMAGELDDALGRIAQPAR